MSKAEIRDKVLSENLFSLRNETRLRRTFHYVYNRLHSLPEAAIAFFVKADSESAKLLTLISIMHTDRMFFEFVYEVYRGKIILAMLFEKLSRCGFAGIHQITEYQTCTYGLQNGRAA